MIDVVFSNSKLITKEEADILYGLVKDNQFANILDLGPIFGFSTVHLAKATEEFGGKVRVIDYPTLGNTPTIEYHLNVNKCLNVDIIKTEDICKTLSENLDGIDFVFVDTLFNRTEEIWEILRHKENLTVVFHDVESEESEEMTVKTFWNNVVGDKGKIITTKDEEGNKNSLGVINTNDIDKKSSPASTPEPEPVVEVVAETEPEPAVKPEDNLQHVEEEINEEPEDESAPKKAPRKTRAKTKKQKDEEVSE